MITASKRNELGSSRSRKIRKNGFVPAILFGMSIPQEMISICSKSLSNVFKKKSFMTKVFSLELDGAESKVLIKDMQMHPVTSNVLHVDFMRVSDDSVVEINVPLKFINEDKSPGMKLSGVLNIVKRKIPVLCKVSNIPEYIEVDLTGALGNCSIKSSSILLPEGVSLKTKSTCIGEFTVATIIAKRQKETA